MIYELCEGVSIENVDGTTVLIDKQGNAALFNESATSILPYLLSSINHNELYEVISKKYDISLNIACTDIGNFIYELLDKGLLQQCEI